MRPAHVAAAASYGVVALLAWAFFTSTTPSSQRLVDVLVFTALVGSPMALAAATLVGRLAAAGGGTDLAERVVAMASAGLDPEWATAMRAELASIDGRSERHRFAAGCVVASLRTAVTGEVMWPAVLASGAFFAAGVFVASRVSLAGGRMGILGILLIVPTVVLFTVGLFAAAKARSFRVGAVTGGLCLVTALVATLAVSMAEGAHWYHVAGVFVMDGDVPKGGTGLDLRTAVLDPLGFALPMLLLWTPWPVIGAAAGDRRTRRTGQTVEPPTPASV